MSDFVCMFCRCSPEDRCRLEANEECGRLHMWADCCTNPKCIIAFDRAVKDARIKIEASRREGKVQGLKSWKNAIARRREGGRHKRRRKVKGRAA